MNGVMKGFQSELLEKVAVIGEAVNFLWKHPMLTTGAITAGLGGAAAASGFKEGLKGERPRFLQASKYGPSDAFYTNYHEVLPHEADIAERRRMSYHYRPGAFGGNQ